MILRELVVRNYGPFFGKHRFELGPSSELERRPICLFGAMNGGGKTSFVDAILISLYGKRARLSKREGRSWPDYLKGAINVRVPPEDGASISLEFEYATPKGITRLRIQRSWRVPGKGVAEQHEVWRDGMRDLALEEAWDQHIEALLPLGLSNLFVFDGELIRDEALADRPSPDVRGAFETLLGLELPKQLTDDLRILVSRKQKELANAPTLAHVESMESELTGLRAERQELKIEVSEWSAKLVRRRKDLERARDAFQAEGGEIARERQRHDRDKAAAQRVQAEHRIQLRQLAEDSLPLVMIRPLVERAAERADTEVSFEQATESLRLMETRDASLLAHLAEGGAAEPMLQSAEDFLRQDREQRLTPPAHGPYLRATSKLADKLRSLANHQLAAAHQQAKSHFDRVGTASQEVDRIDRLLQKSAPPEDVDRMLKRIERATKAVHELEIRIKGNEQRISEITLQVDQIAREMRSTLQRATDSEHRSVEQRRTVKAAEKVMEIMGAYGARLKSRKLGELESLVADLFRHLAHKGHLVHRVEIDEHTFALRMYDDENRQVERNKLSAGEQQMMAVALLWGLAEASGRRLPVIVDTPLARLDGSHRMNLIQRYFPSASHQVIILSTDEEVHERYYKELRNLDAIDREFLIEHDPVRRAATVREGYFWSHA